MNLFIRHIFLLLILFSANVSIGQFKSTDFRKREKFTRNVELLLNDEAFGILNEKRDKALKKGALQTESDSWVRAGMIVESDTHQVKIRLKGDWLDHLGKNKWSFRIKMKTGHVNNVREFSLQHPKTRDYLSEYDFHELLIHEELITTNYDFIRVKVNGENWGWYAIEEHFEKELLDHKGYREGPIVRFSEDGFWNIQVHEKKSKKNIDFKYPVFTSSSILPYSKKRTYKDSSLNELFQLSASMLESYRQKKNKISDVFDADREARLYVLTDIYEAYHGLVWHNRRFYMNPLTGRLESVVYDAFSESKDFVFMNKPYLGFNEGKHRTIYNYEMYFAFQAFNDPEFRSAYFKWMDYYLNDFDWATYFGETQGDLEAKKNQLKTEFSDYRYQRRTRISNRIEELKKHMESANRDVESEKWFDFISWSQFKARHPKDKNIPKARFLREPFDGISLKTFTKTRNETSRSIAVVSFHHYPITIIGEGADTEWSRKGKRSPETLSGYRDTIPQDTLHLMLKASSKFLFYKVEGLDEVYHVKLNKWNAPQAFNAWEKSAFEPFQEIEDGILNIESGHYTIKEDIIIPSGYQVVIDPGVTFDLINGAAFISHSDLEARGRTTAKIQFISSTGENNGVSILGGKNGSRMEFVRFSNLRSNRKQFRNTGGVTMYRTTLTTNNVWFEDCHSEDGLNLVLSRYNLGVARFKRCDSDGLDVDASMGLIENGVFEDIGNDALDFSYSRSDLRDITIRNIGDKGISCGERTALWGVNVLVSTAKSGIVVKDESHINLEDAIIEDCDFGLVLFHKKRVFDPSTSEVYRTTFKRCKKALLLDKGTVLNAAGKKSIGDKKISADIFNH